MSRLTTALFPILLFVAHVVPAHAAAQADVEARMARTVRVATPPAIDGNLSDDAWKSAPELAELIQRDPDENAPPSEATSIRIVYDDDAIYFGVRLDDRMPVTSVVGRRDDEVFTDSFDVLLDPYHDHRSGAKFSVSSANVQSDAVLYNDTYDDSDWDAVWASATKITPGGWTLEIRIPFSQLRFPKRDVHEWGINLRRFIARRHESDWLATAPRNDSLGVSRFAHLTGLDGITPKRAFELMPYGVGRTDFLGTVRSDDPLNDSTDSSLGAGLDLRYPLASNLMLSGTFNPDFGQVEVDPAVVNLSQFETLYPEKRPFFLEGATLFDFGSGGSNSGFGYNFGTPDFFYSRRIGRSPQLSGRGRYDWIDAENETTILGAAKVTGKTEGGWTVAVMDALTQKETAELMLDGTRRESTVEPMTNYLVARLARDLSSRGRIGTIFTAVNRDVDDDTHLLRTNAYTGGIDGYWAFGNRDVIWEWSVGGTHVEGSEEAITATQLSSAHYYDRPDADHVEFDPTRTTLSGWGLRSMLAKQTGKWRYNFQAESFSPGYETNDVGYMTRSDTTATHATLIYSEPEPHGLIRRRNVWIGKYQNWNLDGDLIANGVYGSYFLLFTNYWDVTCQGGWAAEVLDDRLTRGGPLASDPSSLDFGCSGSSDSRKPWFVSFGGEYGRNTEGGHYDEIEFGVRYRPRNNISVSIEPSFERSRSIAQFIRAVPDPTATTYGRRYVFGDLEQRVLEIGTRLDWTFSSKLTLQLYLQPFVAAGDYLTIKEFARERSFDFDEYGVDRGTLAYEPATNMYIVDPDGAGDAAPFNVRNPDFNLRSLRGSAVLRWEFRPGSALYVAWNENREGVEPIGDFSARRDLEAISETESDDVILVKVSWYLPL
jgi:hypothetical protein